MGVEQKTHYMYSLKSSGVASKSGAIQIRPFAEPGLRNCWGGVSATSLTTGLLSLAMMTSSPSMAFCTSSEKRVLASAILNWDMKPPPNVYDHPTLPICKNQESVRTHAGR